MIKKHILNHERIRRIDGGFAFIPHRFLTHGFLSALAPRQQQLYFFLVLAADRHGLSFYSYDSICNLLQRLHNKGFSGQITIVRNLLRKVRGPQKQRQAHIRFESDPGQQMQIDWGHFGSLPYPKFDKIMVKKCKNRDITVVTC